MRAREYRAALEKFDISIVGASVVFGVSRRSAQRYAAGDHIPGPLARLIRMAIRHGYTAEQLTALGNIPRARARAKLPRRKAA